jgi:hypothetical protein
MKHLYEIKKKLSLLLFVGILILCLVFILINCGKGPQSKIIHPDSGQFAVDLNLAPGGVPGLIFVLSSELLNRQATGEFTIEMWVKRKTSSLTGVAFSRHDSEGAVMWFKDNQPKFALMRMITAPLASEPTSTPLQVDSGFSFGINEWYHIAGVLVDAVHIHSSSTTPTVTGDCENEAASERPHLDIYVDGIFMNCGTTWGAPGDTATGPVFLSENVCTPDTLGVGVCAGDTIGIGVAVLGAPETDVGTLNGIIDEVRYWTTARTPREIKKCKGTELGLTDVDCDRNSPDLAAYLKLNEGKGASPSDWTGLGSGSKEDTAVPVDDPARAWDGGWVSGAPITKKD